MVDHTIVIQGIGLGQTFPQCPAMLSMRDTDFPARFFGDLGRASADRISTAQPVMRSKDGYVHLLQPVQRTLQVAMIHLACDSLGYPRLDPKRIESAGIVIRRIPVDTDEGIHRHDLTPEAWMQSADGRFGWTRMNRSEEELDPDPALRPTLFSGQPELDRMLSAHLGQTVLKESFSPAFVAAPEVCERLDKTVVFAVIPTASSEVADQPPTPPDYSDGSLRQQIPPLLLVGAHPAPYAGHRVDYRYMSADYCNANGAKDFLVFANLLQVVAIELGAFDPQEASFCRH